jgi:hypothetical protein
MATTRSIYDTIERWQAAITNKFGTDLDTAPTALKALAHSDAVLLAILSKTLFDAGVITPAQVQAAWVEARDDTGWIPDGPPVYPDRPPTT